MNGASPPPPPAAAGKRRSGAVAAALLAALAGGGVVLVRFASEGEEARARPETPSGVAAAARGPDPIPAPPERQESIPGMERPIEAAPRVTVAAAPTGLASAQAGVQVVRLVGGGSPDPPATDPVLVERAYVRQIVRGAAPPVQACFEESAAGRVAGALAGTVRIAFAVVPHVNGLRGVVADAHVRDPTDLDQSIERCVLDAVRRLEFDAPPLARVQVDRTITVDSWKARKDTEVRSEPAAEP